MSQLLNSDIDELLDISSQLSACRSLTKVCDLAITLVLEKIQSQSAAIFMLDKRGVLRRQIMRGVDKDGVEILDHWFPDEALHIGDSFTGKVLSPKSGTKFGTINWSNHLTTENVDPTSFAKYEERFGNLKCAIAVPLNGTNQTFGAIEAINKLRRNDLSATDKVFSNIDSMWITVISALTAKTITALRRQENLDILANIARELVEPFTATFDLSKSSIENTYKKMIQGLVSPLKSFSVCLLRIKGDCGLQLVAKADDGIDWSDRVDLTISNPERIVQQVADGNRPIIVPNISLEIDRFENKKWIKQNGLQSFACFPLLVHEEVYGTLSVYTSYQYNLSKGDEYLLTNVATLLAAFTDSIRTIEENELLNEQLGEGQERRVTAAREVGLISVESALHKQKIKLGRYVDEIKDIANANAYKKSSLIESLEKQVNEDIDQINLELRRISKRTFSDPVDINEVIREELQFFGLQIKRSHSPIHIHSKFAHFSPLQIDKQEVHEIVSNLLSNAIKAIRSSKRLDGEIIVSTDIVDENDNYFIAIIVTDNGSGIHADDKDHIFDRGYTTHHSGSGFGLFFVKSIVDSYGGSIDFSSASGKGTTFTVKIPKTLYEIN